MKDVKTEELSMRAFNSRSNGSLSTRTSCYAFIVTTGRVKQSTVLATSRLRRVQTFLKAIGIEIAFGREGRAGNRIIRIRSCCDETVHTVSTVSSSVTTATHYLDAS